MSDNSKIATFVEKRIEMVGAACVHKFVLAHEIEGSKPRTLLNCIVNRSDIEGEKERIPDEILDAAKSHAEEASKVQRYSVVAYNVDDSVLAMCPFRLKPSSSDSATEFDSEPATSKGIVSQLMRHNEAQTRIFVQSYQQTMQLLSDELARVRRRNDELEDKNIDMISTFEQLFSEKHSREIELIKETNQESRKERLLDQGEKLLPFIAAKITGQTEIKKFMDTLSDEDMMSLVGVLKPHQLEALKGVVGEGDRIKKMSDSEPAKERTEDAIESP